MTEQARIPLNKELVYLRVEGDFTNGRDEARFSYSLDGKHGYLSVCLLR